MKKLKGIRISYEIFFLSFLKNFFILSPQPPDNKINNQDYTRGEESSLIINAHHILQHPKAVVQHRTARTVMHIHLAKPQEICSKRVCLYTT